MSRVQPEYRVSFTGGLNSADDPFEVDESSVLDCRNVWFDRAGGFTVRGGAQRLTANGTAQWAMFKSMRKADGSVVLIAFVRVAPFFYVTVSNDGGETWEPGAGGGLYAQWWTGSAWSTIVALDAVPWGDEWILMGGGRTHVLDSSGAATATYSGAAVFSPYDAPVSTNLDYDFLATHFSYLFAAAGTTLRWSHPNNPHAWAADDFIDIVDGGGDILALVPNGDHLLVFQRGGIKALFGYDSDSWQLVDVDPRLGIGYHNNVVRTDAGVFFFVPGDGIYVIRGAEQPVRISDPIGDVFKNNQGTVLWGWPTMPWRAQLSWADGKLWFPLRSEGSPSYPPLAVYDPTINGGIWTKVDYPTNLSGEEPRFVFDYRQTDTIPETRMLTNGRSAWRLDPPELELVGDDLNLDDVGERAITAYVQTSWLHANSPTLKKQWRRPDFILKVTDDPYTVTVDSYRNYDLSTVSRTHTIDVEAGASDDDGSTVVRAGNLGPARSVSLRISSSSFARWALDAIVAKFIPRRMR